MLGKNNYYSSVVGQMGEPPNEKFVPKNLNPRIPFWKNVFTWLQPSNIFTFWWDHGYRGTQRPLRVRGTGVKVVVEPNYNLAVTKMNRTTWTGKQNDSNLGNFAQRSSQT